MNSYEFLVVVVVVVVVVPGDDDIFTAVHDEIAAAVDGEAVCILAYGATGSPGGGDDDDDGDGDGDGDDDDTTIGVAWKYFSF